MNPPPLRRRFRFSLRTMFVLVTVFSVWLGYHLNWIRQRREMLKSLPEAYQITTFYEYKEPLRDRFPLSLRILLEQPYYSIPLGTRVSDTELEHKQRFEKVRSLFPEAHLD